MFNDAKKTTFRPKAFLSLLCVVIQCVAAEAASPKREIKEGNRYYQDGEYTASREKYAEAFQKAPESDIVNFDLGTALYKEGDYEKAVDHLQKALLTEDNRLKKNAHYNLGNALYRSGMTHAQDDIGLAVSSLEKALEQYKRVLSIEEGDTDAKYNYDYVQKELMPLKEKQEQQQQQDQQDQQQCDLPKDKEDQQGQDQQSQKDGEGQQQQQPQQQGQQEKQPQQAQRGEEEKQNQSGQDGQQEEQQERTDQGHGQESGEDYNKQQEAGAQPQDARELTSEEAQMLLESYQQIEEPRGLLDVYPRTKETHPVLKDW